MAEIAESSNTVKPAEELETHKFAEGETSKLPTEELKKLTITKEEEEEEPTVKLQTADGVTFDVEASIVKEMETVQTLIDALGASSDHVIPLHNIDSRELGRILEYRAKRRRVGNDPKALKKFDDKFTTKLTPEEMKEMLLAANYLNMTNLLDLISRLIANFIKHKSAEYARDFFGVVSDYTPEEEAAYREANAWAFRNLDKDSV